MVQHRSRFHPYRRFRSLYRIDPLEIDAGACNTLTFSSRPLRDLHPFDDEASQLLWRSSASVHVSVEHSQSRDIPFIHPYIHDLPLVATNTPFSYLLPLDSAPVLCLIFPTDECHHEARALPVDFL